MAVFAQEMDMAVIHVTVLQLSLLELTAQLVMNSLLSFEKI